MSLRRFLAFLNTACVAQSPQASADCRFSLFRVTCVAAVGLASCLPAFCARKVAEPGVTPIQAELMADLHARLLKAGAPIYARVVVDWSGTGCVLRKGAILEARVVSVTPRDRSSKLSEVDLAFTRAQCAAPKMAALDLLLAAMAAPPRSSDLGILSDPLPMNTYGQNGLATLGAMQLSANFDYKLRLDSTGYDFPALPSMHMGDVSGIHGLKLSVGSGTGNSSVLTAKDRDVALDKHTLLLLIPSEGTYPRSASEAPQPVSAVAIAAVKAVAPGPEPAPEPTDVRPPDGPSAPPADDIDLCDHAHCNIALPPGDEIDGGKPEVRISVSQLGYAPRAQKEMTDFDRDEALAWLGPGQLLVTFNPHELVPRHSLGPSGSTQRVIRAALLDTGSRTITRTVDWELPDNSDYLWPLADNRVLVHVASELRVYGEGLKITRRVALDGPLAFVRVTPDGNFTAVGQVRERHSPELHAQLTQALQRDPEEDVAVTVLNREFETISRSDGLSGLVPPTLLNEGQARLLPLRNQRYRVTLLTWDGRTSVLASFGSGCSPQLSSLAPDLLFLISCNSYNHLREYRILNSSGKLILKGDASPSDLGHAAKGNANPGTFVVKAIRSSEQFHLGDAFSASSLDSEELEVYRAADGKRLFGVRVGSPSSSLDGYALAANDAQLAVLTRDQVSIYRVGDK